MRRFCALLLVVLSSALAATAGTAKAGLITGLLGGNCGATAPVFAPWGDWAGYYFAPNGGFENGSTGWTLGGGAAVVGQPNEPWYLAGFGSHALQAPTGGSASINVCYGLTYPGVLGILSVLDGGTFQVNQGWTPTPKISTLFSAVAAPLGTKSMTLQFTVESGTAQIDDLFVDPLLSQG
jgi:hypothetical protein